ncbi:unnamed protein product [Chilo suppressalis]|uniref:Uncharacterized protein n=1 Tax=Chilo suppressalis TaxID=168631 RepID=A0ABN8AY14_CHISP|nr:unnamed protein product [Chilo suppressalis]
MRSFAHDIEVPYDQFGFQVGKVIESKNSEFLVDTYVVSQSGWRDYTVLDGREDEIFGMRPYKPEIGNLPLSLSVGALGMPGITAYLSLLEIYHAFNCKRITAVKDNLMSITPKGINIFFDNVGGAFSFLIMECMNENGRVAICGAISTYGGDLTLNTKPNTRVSVYGETFSFAQWKWPKQIAAPYILREWIQKGSIKAKDTITNGFKELTATLVAMYKGESIGKNFDAF